MSIGLHFRNFNPEKIRPFSSILFCGGKRTGKSTVMRDFMYHIKKRVYDTTIFSGTRDEEHPWENYTPRQYVHYCMDKFDSNSLYKTMKIQEDRKLLSEKHKVECPASLVVLEDLEFLKPSIWVDQGIRGMMFNGRWYKEFFFVAYQYVMEVRMEMRGSFDYAVFTLDSTASGRERIWKQFASVFPEFVEFDSIFKEMTADFGTMVIDLRCRSYNLEDAIFYYKASERSAFKMGHPDVWKQKIPLELQNPLSNYNVDFKKQKIKKSSCGRKEKSS